MLTTVLVFVLSEAIGLPFCYSGADNMLNGNIAKGLTGFAVGLSFCVLGVAWVFFSGRFNEPVRSFVRECAADIRIWAFVLLLLFTWMVFPASTPDHRLLMDLDSKVTGLEKEMGYYVLPRRITSNQYDDVLKYLSDKSPQSLTVTSVEDDRESVQYASDLEQMFQAAKWTVKDARISLEQLRTQVGMNEVEGVFTVTYGDCTEGEQLVNGAFEAMKVLIVGGRGGGSSKPEPCKMTLYVGRRLRVYLPRTKQLEVPEE